MDKGDNVEIKDRKRLRYATLLLPLHSQSLLTCLCMHQFCLKKGIGRGSNNLGTNLRS